MTETDIAWASIPGDEWYSPERVVPAFAGVRAGSDSAANGMLFAIANNHCGELYPAAYHAVPILLDIAATESNARSGAVALAILDDLLWFGATAPPFNTVDVEGKTTSLDLAVRQLVREALPNLSSQSNSSLVEGLAESLTQLDG